MGHQGIEDSLVPAHLSAVTQVGVEEQNSLGGGGKHPKSCWLSSHQQEVSSPLCLAGIGIMITVRIVPWGVAGLVASSCSELKLVPGSPFRRTSFPQMPLVLVASALCLNLPLPSFVSKGPASALHSPL